jgi:aspartyl-tRNA(Asn)/glutamyl-tRNA(Gln) amidotransferase subunit A
MSNDVISFTVQEITEKVRNQQISAEDILEKTIEHIQHVDGDCWSLNPNNNKSVDNKLHAFITHTWDQARSKAREIDRLVASGEDPGPLAGVPFTIKDIFCVEGTPTTAGSRILANFISPYTATPVDKMLAAGGVMLGKVNLDEFTYGSSSESSAFQPSPHNPWDTTRVPGGSSGGSAVAVAAGEGTLSLGTDTAGSIRQPAAFCGVVGVKPTYGRVSRYGLIAFGSSLDCPGPVAKNIPDAAAMLQIIAGQDEKDATTANVPVPDYLSNIKKEIRGFRIGLSPDYFRITFPNPKTGELAHESITSEIQSAVLRVAGRLAELGADIVEDVPMPHTQYGIPTYFVISRVEASSNLHRFDGVKYGFRTSNFTKELSDLYRLSRGQGFGLQPKLRILMGLYVSAAQYSKQHYNRALKVRTLIRQDFDEIFDPRGKFRLDALLTPTTPTTAFPLGGVYGDSVLMQYADQLTVPANHAGIPGLSFPAGFDGNGLPIGVQLLGPDFSESLLLQIGHAYENVTAHESWRLKKPDITK